jgi:ribosomal protein S4
MLRVLWERSGRDRQHSPLPGVQEAVALSPAYLPAWLTRAGGQGGVVSTPRRADIEADIREDLIVEFYSR